MSTNWSFRMWRIEMARTPQLSGQHWVRPGPRCEAPPRRRLISTGRTAHDGFNTPNTEWPLIPALGFCLSRGASRKGIGPPNRLVLLAGAIVCKGPRIQLGDSRPPGPLRRTRPKTIPCFWLSRTWPLSSAECWAPSVVSAEPSGSAKGLDPRWSRPHSAESMATATTSGHSPSGRFG